MILRGWKDICSYLGGISEVSARRLMRWGGLPVCRILGKPMTTTDQLEAWVEKTCQEKSSIP